MHCTSRSLLKNAFGSALHRPSTLLPPSFLLPSLPHLQTTPFSTTPHHHARKDNNPSRGVSALHRTGPGKKQKLSIRPSDLPKPVPRSRRSAVQVDENHGLYDFFNKQRESMSTPVELAAHGRGWTVPELRNKDWEDLWRLWWVCLKERNRMNTFSREKERAEADGGKMYGDYEMEGRVDEVKKTQKAIRHVLTERWYAWENARVAAMEDEEIDLYADPEQGGQAYLPVDRQAQHLPPLEGVTDQAGNEPRLPPPEPSRSGSEARM